MLRKILFAFVVLAAVGGGAAAYNVLTAAPAVACGSSGCG